MAGRARWRARVGLLLALLLSGCTRYGFGLRGGDRGPSPAADAPGRDAPAGDTSGKPPGDGARDSTAADRPRLDAPAKKDATLKLDASKDQQVPDKPVVIPAGFVKIAAATFTMGSPVGEPCRTTFETQHQVTLTRAYLMGKYETGLAEFQLAMGYVPISVTACGLGCPVVDVTWHEAAAYCNKLSSNEGLAPCYTCTGSGPSVTCTIPASYADAAIYGCPGYRLPTEAEWENAYRGGTTTAYYNGANNPGTCQSCSVVDANLGAIAWYCANTTALKPRGQKLANPFGLYDMAGNAWEWCHDAFDADLSGVPVVDPVTSVGITRVVRGGAFALIPVYARAAARINDAPGDRYPDLGFRCARSLVP